jgi:hypothetical protein
MVPTLTRNCILIAVLPLAGPSRSAGAEASGGVATAIPQHAAASGFYAYHTRLPFDDDNNTGKYADIVVNLDGTGQLVFSREFGYLPFPPVQAGSRQAASILGPARGA